MANTSFEIYCLNPPDDSCEYNRYCPNPDIASPAIRGATYLAQYGLSILILHSHSHLSSSFYAQLLAEYSLLISVLISIGFRQQVTRLHAIFALVAACSPLSLWLVFNAGRATLATLYRTCEGKEASNPGDVEASSAYRAVSHDEVDEHGRRINDRKTHLDSIFGPGNRVKMINRVLVLLLVPIWATLLVCVTLPKTTRVWFGFLGKTRFETFPQSACDSIVGSHLTMHFFYGPLNLVIGRPSKQVAIVMSPFMALVVMWCICVLRQLRNIWKEGMTMSTVWRTVTAEYPFIFHLTIVTYPTVLWIFTLEDGVKVLDESFQPTYGQLLAIFVAAPPLVQCVALFPQFCRWLGNLFWVRLIVGCGRRRPKGESVFSTTFPSPVPINEDRTDIYSNDSWTTLTLTEEPAPAYQ